MFVTWPCTLRSPAYGHRPGYTLVELLVVLAILATLSALVLAGVQRVRTAAARVACQNHLRQIGLGWHNHLSQHGFYPTIGIRGTQLPVTFNGVGNPAVGGPNDTYQAAGWMYQLLPLVDQEPLWRQSTASTPEAACRIILATPVPVYFCPSRDAPRTWHLAADATVPFRETCPDRAGHDYTANGGIKLPPRPNADEPDTNGVFSRDEYSQPRRLSESAFTDGLSVTLFVGEAFSTAANRTPQAISRRSGYTIPRSTLGTTADHDPKPKPPRQDDDPKVYSVVDSGGFGSPHPGGMNTLFGDGSVRVIPYAIDPQVWLNLCRRDDGNPVPPF